MSRDFNTKTFDFLDTGLGESTIRHLRRLIYFLVPGLLPVGLIAFVVAGPMSLLASVPTDTLGTWLRVFPFVAAVLFVVGIGLSIYFNATRLTLMGFFLLVVYGYVMLPRVLVSFIGRSPGPTYYNSHILFPVVIPVTFIALHFTKDTGFFNQAGLAKALALVLEVVGLMAVFPMISEYVYAGLKWIPQVRILNEQVNVPFVNLGLSVMALVVFLVFSERDYYSNYISLLFWILLTASLAFSVGVNWPYHGLPYHYALFFAGAGLLYNLKVVNLAWSKAYRDQLTQIPGRIALDEYLQRLGGRYAICMIDIDHFKDFNDTYGHDAGDKVLKQVADTIQTETRGRAFRFGGEEFTVIYPGEGVEDVKDELEELRETIEDNKVKVTRKSKRATKILERTVTISLGLAENGEAYDNAEEVLNAADNALFEAKDEGRNKLLLK